MSKAIGTLIVLLLVVGAWQFQKFWNRFKEKEEAQGTVPAAAPTGNQLSGMPANLEPSLNGAKQKGAAGLKQWLQLYRRAVADPRLASIELDYVVLISREDPAEAKRVFAEVKKRTPPNSPLYSRIKTLEKTYD